MSDDGDEWWLPKCEHCGKQLVVDQISKQLICHLHGTRTKLTPQQREIQAKDEALPTSITGYPERSAPA